MIIDELPVMLYLFRDNGVSDTEVRAFLYWFRRMRTDPQIGLTNCRFLIGGSIGIESYLSDLNAVDSFNDFERVTLPELTSRRAADFLEQLLESRQVALSPSAQSKILSLIGVPMPYFIQIFVNEVASEQVNKPASLGPRRLEEIYQGRVLGASCKSYFQHYYDRLRHYFDKQEEDAAKALLKELALAQPRPVRGDHLYTVYRKVSGESGTEDGFARLVAALENDFYIRYHSADRGYYFASKILCDWWRRYYAF